MAIGLGMLKEDDDSALSILNEHKHANIESLDQPNQETEANQKALEKVRGDKALSAEDFALNAKDKIAKITSEMEAIGDYKNKRYQLLRKRRDGLNHRMKQKLNDRFQGDAFDLLKEVTRSILDQSRHLMTDKKRKAFNRELVKALKNMWEFAPAVMK